jgi:hypothetical protein
MGGGSGGGSSKCDVIFRGSGAGAADAVTGVITTITVGIAAASVQDARQSTVVETPSGQHGQ